ncbi:unnamed protein product [Rotaria sordida]|uniref:Uncharacterized protein n=1 Tax=Rotaria sordida TaxID=392033 RepID=A0A814ZYV6_9BILA|nr:unnamed protein product [Rotaria sordida]
MYDHLCLFLNISYRKQLFTFSNKCACPFCQDVFLKLLIKREADNDFSFDVITINCKNPPKEFKEISKKLPTLVWTQISERSLGGLS